MLIPFNTKLTENQIDSYLEKYWNSSFEDSTIIFDLSILEWINVEEIAFLFSWIRNLKISNKKVNVYLPYVYNIHDFQNLTDEIKKIISESNFQDSTKRRERRERLNLLLLSVWRMLTRIGINASDFKNIVEGYNKKIERLINSEISQQVIPFTVLDSSYEKGLKVAVDNEFESALNGYKTKNNDNEENSKLLFELNNKIIALLNQYACYSPFESNIISQIITKELFINSIEHSGVEECYFTIALKNKWESNKSENFINSFLNEKNIDCLDFYKDKESILNQFEKLNLSNYNLDKEVKYREADLSKYNSSFRNISYLEFTFLDFGRGIFSTLKEQFEKDKDNLSESFSKNFADKDEHSQILEYAFLIESSRNPYDRSIDYSELIPRGLYFLVDMVRRFKGLLVARSGNGKVIYDFSDKIFVTVENKKLNITKERIYQANDAIRELNSKPAFFDGTMISIVLPERRLENLKMTPVRIDNKELNRYIFNLSQSDVFPSDFFSPDRFEYLSLVFLHQEALMKLSYEELNTKTSLDNYIFQSIDKKLNELKGIRSILFLDFEFLYERDNYLKILTWLSNTPKVNEFTKVIVFNLTEQESKVISKFKANLKDKKTFSDTEFLYKPIPCININKPIDSEITKKDIQWIGIKEDNHEELLTALLFGEKNSYPLTHFEKIHITEGHVISSFQERVYSNLNDFSNIISSFKKEKQNFLVNWIINNEIKDGVNPQKGKEQFIYLTSRGNYQQKYISLYETLHNKYIARLYAKYLIDRYIENCISSGRKKTEIKVNKIIVVTVCSQLIGVAIRDLIRDNPEYSFLKIQSKHNSKYFSTPKLIRLASYYSFNTEKPFENLTCEDNVLIVNDVISTGSLVERMINGIERKGTQIEAILSIVDNRFNKGKMATVNSVRFLPVHEKNLISVLDSSIIEDDSLDMLKSDIKPKGISDIKRINPILNNVVELSYNHSENHRVLYEKSEDFINSKFCNESVFRLGHFQQSLSHNGYYTDMVSLFESENGKELLLNLRNKIEQDIELHKLSNHENIINNLKNVEHHINKLKSLEIKDVSPDIEDIKTIDSLITKLLNKFESSIPVNGNYVKRYKPDFIFHPVFSGIEEVSDIIFHEVFGTDVDNIVGLQRYNTRNGWRFPFPAKRYNKLTKGKQVLIIDSGSLTGDSLVQLIDSISFLEVGRIDFLSIIGRLDDFQREFYSRLKSIKVKNLTQGDEKKRYVQTIVNMNLLFGLNLHIPPYSSKVVCPYCQEINKLNSYYTIYKNKRIPYFTECYIKNRLKQELRLIEDREELYIPKYIPIRKDNNEPDFKNIFITRDKIGKVDSYRFYHEYFKPFDKIAERANGNVFTDIENLKQLELILICILHEENLYNLTKDLLVNIHKHLDNILDLIVFSEENQYIEKLNYKWSKYALVRLSVLFLERDLFNNLEYERLISFTIDDNDGLNYLSFLLSEALLEDEDESKARKVLGYLFNKTRDNKDVRYRFVRDITQNYETSKVNNIKEAYLNLYKFFTKEASINTHGVLGEIFPGLSRNISNPKYINENQIRIYSDIELIINNIKDNIFDNLVCIKNEENIKNCYKKSYRQLFGNNSIFSSINSLLNNFDKLDSIDKKSEEYISKLESLGKELCSFEFKYLNIEEKPLNVFLEFCLNYYSDVYNSIEVSRSLEHIKKKYLNEAPNLEINNLVTEGCLIELHFELLNGLICEIIKNSAKNAKRLLPEKDNNVILTFALEQNEDCAPIFIINQNKPFYNPENIKRGTIDIIEKILNNFIGESKYEMIYEPNYTIKITL